MRRGSQVVRQGSAKALCVGSIPTLASSLHNLFKLYILRDCGDWISDQMLTYPPVFIPVQGCPGLPRFQKYWLYRSRCDYGSEGALINLQTWNGSF